MNVDVTKARSIFSEAVENHAPDQWGEFLDGACGEDIALRRRVELLLKAHQGEDSFLDRGDEDQAVSPTIDQPITEKPGTQIGPYKLLQQIDEGGMGVVYLAEQKEPVKRQVALKIIKPGMDTRQVIARFEAERQALAMMDHPNIAKVLDAGATVSGRPYFVMELVNGLPVTKYCDEQHLTPKERLELFVPICQAVQHAHQKGIIHRDLKPSNILVAMYDNKAVPKIIDFGVAKATSQTLTEKTIFTQLGQVVGTLEYMSPEQAERNQLDIDTRSDIYSLGVVLYELLTGETPFDRQRLRSAAFDEMLRIIREEEPSKPSTKVSSTPSLPSIAANRGIEPAKLGSIIRGELDWIVMKALAKDRGRRYETASGFAGDIQRYLNDEPVQACPPSAVYCLRKLVRRNRRAVGIAAIGVVIALTIAGLAGWFARDRAERRARLVTRVGVILNDARRLEREQRWSEALIAAERAAAVIDGGESDDVTTARVQQLLNELNFVRKLDAARQVESHIAGGTFDRVGAAQAYTQAFSDFGLTIDGVSVGHIADRLQSGPEIVDAVATALVDWARLQRMLSETEGGDHARWQHLLAVADAIDPDDWRRELRAAWKTPDVRSTVLRDLAGSANLAALPAASVVLLARLLAERGSADEAATLLLKVRQGQPADFWINFDLANFLASSSPKRLDEAITYFQAALSLRPGNPAVLNNLAIALNDQKKHDEAIACYRAALVRHPDLPRLHNNLGNALQDQGKVDEAITEFRTAIALAPRGAVWHSNLGFALQQQGNLEAATTEYRKAIALDAKFANPHNLLGSALEVQRNFEEAVAEYRRAIELDRRHVKAYINLGHVFFTQGRINEAMAEFRAAIALDPDDAEAHSNLGGALHLSGKPVAALAELRRSIELDPKRAPAHNNLGHVLQDLGQLDESIAEYRLASQLDRTVAEPHLNLGTALADQGKLDQAIDEYRAAIERDPDDPAAYYNLGNALKKLGKLDEAVTAYRRAIKLDSTMAAAHYSLGNAFQRQDQFDEAMNEFQRAIQLDVTLAEPHNNLGNVLRKLGRLDEAIDEFHAALALNPRLGPAQYNLGTTLHDQKKLPEAVAAFNRAIELAPENAAAYNGLGAVLYDQGDQDGAIAALRKAFEIGMRVYGPQHPITQMARTNAAGLAANRSWFLSTAADQAERDPSNAVTLARLATDLQPDNANHWNNLGVAHYRRGDFQSAIDAFERADTLLNGSDRAHRMFVAMAHWRLGRCDAAREFYAQGAAWVATHAEQDEEQRKFRDEAEALMGIDADQRDALIREDTCSTTKDSQYQQ